MTQSNTTDQQGQGSLGETLAALAQLPLTRLRSVPIPIESRDADPAARASKERHLGRPPVRPPVRVRVPFFPVSTGSVIGEGFSVLQQWEGTVSEVKGDEVTAVLRDWTNPTMADEEVTVSIDEFSPDDQPLLAAGTVFYWSIGYRTRRGTRERVSSFQLRRIPPPSIAQRVRAEKEGAVLARLLGASDPGVNGY